MSLPSRRPRPARQADDPTGPGIARRVLDRVADLARRRRAMAGSLLALVIKTSGTVLMMLVFLMAARAMSPHDFGQLAVAFNALSFLAVVAVFGQDVLVIRSWAEYRGAGADGLAHGACRFGAIVTAASASVFGALTLVAATANPYHRFALAEALAAAAFLSVQILMLFVSQTTRVVVNFVVAEINRELSWRLFLVVAAFVGLATGLTPTVFFATAAGGIALAVLIQIRALHRTLPTAVREARPVFRRREWLARARGMWTSAVLEAAAQYAEVLLLGLLVSPAVAGLYFVAARVANIFAMMGTGLHSYTVTHTSNLFYSGRMPALQGMFRAVMSVALLLAVPILAVVVLFGAPILNIFGPHFAEGYGVLVILSCGSFTAAMAGPSNGLLLTTGHERLYSRVLFAALLVRVALIAWAAPRYGALGVAAAWAGVNGPVAVGLAVVTRMLTGIDPSILSIAARGGTSRRTAGKAPSGLVARPTAGD